MVISFLENMSTQANSVMRVCCIHIIFLFTYYVGLQLEAQYWWVLDLQCHFDQNEITRLSLTTSKETFLILSTQFQMNTSQVRCIRREISCYFGGKLCGATATICITNLRTKALTLNQSTTTSMFWMLDQINQVVTQLANIGVCVCIVLLLMLLISSHSPGLTWMQLQWIFLS